MPALSQCFKDGQNFTLTVGASHGHPSWTNLWQCFDLVNTSLPVILEVCLWCPFGQKLICWSLFGTESEPCKHLREARLLSQRHFDQQRGRHHILIGSYFDRVSITTTSASTGAMTGAVLQRPHRCRTTGTNATTVTSASTASTTGTSASTASIRCNNRDE